MKIKVKGGTINTTKKAIILAGGLFTLTGTSLIASSLLGGNNPVINWKDVIITSGATSTVGTTIAYLSCYRSKIIKDLYNKPKPKQLNK